MKALKDKRRLVLQGAVCLCAAVMLVLGLMRGEAADVLRKAVMVCLECIGIG